MASHKRKKSSSSPKNPSFDKLRAPVKVLVTLSQKLVKNKKLASENIHTDLVKISTLAEQLLERFDAVLAGSRKGKRYSDILSRQDTQTIHDLRTPLNGIIGFSELLLEGADDEIPGKDIADLKKLLSAANDFLATLDSCSSQSNASGDAGETPVDKSNRDRMIESAMRSISRLSEQKFFPVSSRTGAILVVDDNAVNRDLLSSQLGRQGHSVKLAGNGKEALDIMLHEPVDLVLLDIMMPEMNGFEVLEHMNSNPKIGDIPVIVISALDNIKGVVQCMQMGAADYLLKPFEPVILNTRVGSCLEKKRLTELSITLEQRNLHEEFQFISESGVMQRVLDTVITVSRNPVNVLLHGGSGTGTEVIARMIHSNSDRKLKPFVAVNCASIPENLVESEFFGYEKGAFTGAESSRGGYFEEAAGGTLFLDEIGDMPMFVQPKLLRAIQEGEGRRLGGSRTVPYDVRIISATNKNLKQEVEMGRFRKDLFYRIFSVEIHIPPLKERREDIVPLALFFLNKVCRLFNKKINGFSAETLGCFEQYTWPGNVRQLLHEIERLVAFTPEGEQALLKHCSPELLGWKNSQSVSCSNDSSSLSLSEKVRHLEINCINEALRQTKGKKLPAAKLLGITRVGLDNKIKRYGITY
jgi:DNA-binding NtrC family response regulator